ncbi:MAG: cyclodeaminase/cyclohydrolase family protein [Planctomycetes bacterium]|nr:cyclodeaminase/cyclohydrolase family protein [Planctomycetota bacterium]
MADAAFQDFVAALAARTPAPGGGAAAARTAAMGAALFAMVLRYSVGKPANREHEAELGAALATVDGVLMRILPLDDLDMAAFTRVLDAYRLPKDGEAAAAEREAAIQTALAGAMEIPARLGQFCEEVLEAIVPVAGCIGRNIVADLCTGAELLLAAGRSARAMVAINALGLRDREAAARALAAVDAVLGSIGAHRDRIRAHVDAAIG